MRHDWILDMLADLQDYARRNDLPELAQKTEEALVVARREIGEATAAGLLELPYLQRQRH
jgi:hypothetical protein